VASVSIVNETSGMIAIVHRFVDMRNGRDPLSGVEFDCRVGNTDRVIDSLIPDGIRLVLASASPRRRELLSKWGVEFDVRPADADESVHDGESPLPYVQRVAAIKAAAIGGPGELVIAADTTVDVDGTILAKPEDVEDARRMLLMLSGRTHFVHTAVAIRLVRADGSAVEAATTSTSEVHFAALDEATIDWYLSTGEPFGKAGAYALQGAGARLVEWVHGSVSGIIGLPMSELLTIIKTFLV